MKKPSFGVWAVLVTAIVLIGLCVAAVCLSGQFVKTESGTVVFRIAEPQQIELHALETPVPSPEPIELPEGAVDVLLAETDVVLTLATEDEARSVLTAYLQTCMDERASKTERPVRARFDAVIHIVSASGTRPLDTPDGAMRLLGEDPTRIPVVVETEERQVSVGAVETTAAEDKAIEKGNALYTQIGRGEETLSVTPRIYRAGVLESTGTPAELLLFEARTTIVRKGAYTVKDPAQAEPDKKEGPHGKSAGDLKLALPIRSAVSSWFGMRGGKLHRGIDIPARAGTKIASPGEGIVVFAAERGEYGVVVEIDHGNGFVSRLTHCADLQVELNQRVFQGDTVAALAENTEGSGKPHLHYELLIDGVPYNPYYYLF